MLETRREIERGEVRMTWTLVAMTACYCLSVGPIVVCTLLGVEANIPYLLCFILYWFQVLAGLSAILSQTKSSRPQYIINFVIYAARSEQYRRAFMQYIKEMTRNISSRKIY